VIPDSEIATLRSSVLPGLMRRTLFRGTWMAGIGVFLILGIGAFLPPQHMKTWGIFVFLAGIALITLGLLPYKRLKKLEENPNLLKIDQTSFHYFLNGKKRFSIPIASIHHLGYTPQINSSIQQATEEAGQAYEYGIKVVLNESPQQKIVVQDPHFDFARFSQKCMKKHECDLFLPYFSPRTYFTLLESTEHLKDIDM
jgi:hypothetical protein